MFDDDPCSATTAYLAVSGYLDDASAALLACQLALHQALESARAAVYADALDLELGRDAAAAAAAAARFEAIASDPATEFVWDLAGECAAGLARFADSASGGRSGNRNAFKSPLQALLAEARGAQADRAPCPAAALEMLRGGDAAMAVNAVADAAAEAAGAFARMGLGGAAGGGVRERSCEVGRGAAELLRAAAALLNGGGGGGGGGVRLSPSATFSLLSALRRLCKLRSAPDVAVEDVSRWTEAAAREPTWIDVNSSHSSARSRRGDADSDSHPRAATVAARDWVLCTLLTPPEERDGGVGAMDIDGVRGEVARCARALCDCLLAASSQVRAGATSLLQDLCDATGGPGGGERATGPGGIAGIDGAPVALLGAMLARLPRLCASQEPSDAMRVTHLLLRLAVGRGEAGARAAAVGLAALIPGFGSAGGPLRPGLTVGWGATCGIFLLAGLGLPTSELAAAAVRVKEHTLIQGFSLGLIPLFTLGFVRVLAPLNAAVGSVLPGGVLDGLLALAALPTTVNMCVALTRSAGGSEALAIFNAVIGNLLGVFVTPALLLYLLGRESTIAFVAVFSKLCLKVLLPLCVGQLLRPVIGKATLAANKKKLGRSSEGLLLLTVAPICISDLGA